MWSRVSLAPTFLDSLAAVYYMTISMGSYFALETAEPIILSYGLWDLF